MRYFKRIEDNTVTQLFAYPTTKDKDGDLNIQTWNIAGCTRHSIPESWSDVEEIDDSEFIELSILTGLLTRPKSPVPSAV